MSIAAGDKAPDFTVKTDGNGTVALAKLKGRNVGRRAWRKVRVPGHVGEALAAVKAL